jgi:hypothetical protein
MLEPTTTVLIDEPSTRLLETTTDEEILTTTVQIDEPSTFLLETTTDEEILTTTIQIDEPSTLLLETTTEEETLTTTNFVPLETTAMPTATFLPTTLLSTITDEYTEEYTSTQSSLEITSTSLPIVYSTKTEHSTFVATHSSARPIRPSKRKTSTTSTTRITTIRTTTPPPTTTEKLYQTSQQTTTITTEKLYPTSQQPTTFWASQSSPTITSTTFIPTTSTTEKFFTTPSPSPVIIWHSKFNPLDPQQMVIIKPSLNTNTLLSDELFKSLFNSTTNSSTEKLIYFNLNDLPPSTWNISLQTIESILLDIALPAPTYPSYANTTTNLTITNVEANRFSTNIVGVPINLLVDLIQTKQFSLAMNLTHNQTNQSSSDVVIGHVKSEQFELNITKSDNMNVHVQQVDSETAELFFDSQFCTNETNLQINLNISKNGKRKCFLFKL